jgi:hypothetical protein
MFSLSGKRIAFAPLRDEKCQLGLASVLSAGQEEISDA